MYRPRRRLVRNVQDEIRLFRSTALISVERYFIQSFLPGDNAGQVGVRGTDGSARITNEITK